MITIPQIEEIAARAAKATPGPWVHVKDIFHRLSCWIISPSEPSEDFPEGYPLCDFRGTDPTADFIAAARFDVPALCSTALSAIRERDAYKAAIEKEAHGINCRSRKLLPFGRKARAEFDSSCDCWKSRIGVASK